MVMIPWMISINIVFVSTFIFAITCYFVATQLWFEVRRLKGNRPKPRYRHSAVAMNNTIFIFGGVDTNPERFNDLF